MMRLGLRGALTASPTSRLPSAETLDDAGLDGPGGAQQEMAAHGVTRHLRQAGKRHDAIQTIAQQQRALRQLREQPLGQRPFRFALAADRRGQRIVQPDLQEDGGRDLGEGRTAPARPGLLEGRGDLRRVDQTELRAVETDQTPAPPKRLAVPAPRRAGPQRAAHQLGKDLPRQPQPPIRPRTVGQRRAEQLEEMLGQRAGVVHHMKGQRGQHLRERHARLPPAPRGQRGHAARADQARPRVEEAGRGAQSCVDIPRVSTDFAANSTRGFSPQRISERHWSKPATLQSQPQLPTVGVGVGLVHLRARPAPSEDVFDGELPHARRGASRLTRDSSERVGIVQHRSRIPPVEVVGDVDPFHPQFDALRAQREAASTND